MKSKARRVILSLLLAILLLWLIFQWHYPKFPQQTLEEKTLVSVISQEDEYGSILKESTEKGRSFAAHCQMETCFDFQQCIHGFKVYVYPFTNGERVSSNYAKIIHVIKKSTYHTSDPSEACLFVSSYDTTDQDVLSTDYVSNLGSKIATLPYWNGGRNHIIFSLYTGTWPYYSERLNFPIGQAILVKASFSVDYYRPNFDISFPLFDKTQAQYNGGNLPHSDKVFPVLKKYKLAFKGKRYLNGIGSESRSSLHHIHNNKDIIMLTTCKHGRNWKDLKDARCNQDNELFDR